MVERKRKPAVKPMKMGAVVRDSAVPTALSTDGAKS